MNGAAKHLLVRLTKGDINTKFDWMMANDVGYYFEFSNIDSLIVSTNLLNRNDLLIVFCLGTAEIGLEKLFWYWRAPS